MSHLLKFRSSIAVLAMVVALFLVGVSGSWGGPTAAGQAATVTFLDNLSTTLNTATGPDQIAVGKVLTSTYKKAAPFQTGSNPRGYTLASVTINMAAFTNDMPVVKIHSSDSGGKPVPGPDGIVHTLESPTDRSASEGDPALLTFTAESGATLDPSTNYHVVMTDISGDNWHAVTHGNRSGTGVVMQTGWSFNADGLTNKDEAAAWTTAVAQAGRTFHMKLEGMVNPNPGVTVSSAPTSVTEGSTATYTVVLDSQPSHSVTITPTSSDTTSVTTSGALTFSTTDWETAQTMTLTGVQDDNPIDESVTISHTVSSMDTGYSNYRIDDFTVTADDNDTASVTVSKTSLSMDEEERDAGGLETGDSYTLVLGTQPGPGERVTITPSTTNRTLLINPTSVSFNENNWNSPVEVKVQSGPDDNLIDETSTITHAVSGYGSSAASIAVTVSDNDTPSVDLSWTNRAIGEGSSATYEIKLGFEPSGTVTVTIVQPTNTDVTIDTDTGLAGNQNTLAFTGGSNGNWSTPQPVTISVGEDSDSAAENATIEHTVAGANYAGTTVGDVIVSVFDSASPGILVSKTTLTISEARGQSTYKVKLATQPTVDVTLTPSTTGLNPSDTRVEISPPSLLFTTANWSTEQTVTVTAPAADNDLASTTVNLVHLISSTDPVYFEGSEGGFMLVTVRDNDTAGITVSPLILSPNEAGSAETYTVVLDYRPSNTVLVKIVGPSGLGMTIIPTELEFTSFDWNTPVSVMVSAAADDDLTNEMVTIAHAVTYASAGRWTGLSVDSVSVTVFDDDGPGVSITPTSLGEIDEGATATYDVELNTVPTGNVTVTLAVPTDGGVSVSGTTLSSNELTFTTGNWSTAQRVTVTADEDEDAFNNSGMITHSVSGYGSVNSGPPVTFTVDDNETPGVVITGARMQMDGTFHMTVPEDGTATYNLALASKPYPDDGTVTVAIGVPTGTDLSLSSPTSASVTFDSDNWETGETVTLAAASDADSDDDDVTVTHVVTNNGADYGDVIAPSLDVTVKDSEANQLKFSRTTIPVDETDIDVEVTYTVVLTTKPALLIDVAIASDNAEAADTHTDTLEFGVNDWNVPQEVTVTVYADADAVSETVTINHTATRGDYNGVSGIVTIDITDDDKAQVLANGGSTAALTVDEDSSIEYTLSLAAEPTSPVTVALTAVGNVSFSDSTVELTETVELTVSNWMDGETITVYATDDADALDGDAVISHTISAGPDEYVNSTEPLPVANVTIIDLDTAAITVSDSSLTVSEGGAVTYTMVLTSQPGGDVEITPMAAGSDLTFTKPSAPYDALDKLTFTTVNWETPQTVRVVAAADDDAQEDVAEVTHAVSGYVDKNNIIVTADPVTVTVTDPQEQNVVVVPADTDNNGKLDILEGDTTGNTYTVKLDTRPVDADGVGTSVTIGINAVAGLMVTPSTLTFNGAGTSNHWNMEQTVTVTAGPDADGVDEDLPNGITHNVTSTGSDYDGFSIDPVAVYVTDPGIPGVEFSGVGGSAGAWTLAVVEDVGISYSIKLATDPSASVTVTFAGDGMTFNPPSLSFSSGDYDFKSVEVTASDDDAAHDTLTIEHTLTMASGEQEYNGLSVDDITVEVEDQDTKAIVVSATQLDNLNEGSNTSYTVKLGTKPVHATETSVTVSIDVPTGASISVNPTSLAFNNVNWDTERTVTVTANSDADELDNSYILTHSASGMDYEVDVDDVSLTVNTVDEASHSLRLSEASLELNEGSTSQFNVRLNTEPTDDVEVAISLVSGGDANITLREGGSDVNSINLTFTTGNWNTDQQVTVAAAEDFDAATDTAELRYQVTGAPEYVGANPANTPVEVTDNDSLGVNVEPGPLQITEADDGSASGMYDVTLTAAPSDGDVTIVISVTGSPDVTTNPSSLVFRANDWTTAQQVTKPVTVNVANDLNAEDVTATILHEVRGADYETENIMADSKTVEVEDNDEASIEISGSSITEDPLDGSKTATGNENSFFEYQIKLTAQPTGNVTVTISNPRGEDPTSGVEVNTPALEFSADNWNTNQPVSVVLLDDDDSFNDRDVIMHTIAGPDAFATAMAPDLNVVTMDADSPEIVIGDPPLTTLRFEEGTEATYEVKLSSKPVNMDGSDGQVNITIVATPPLMTQPSSLTFNADNWDDFQEVTVTGEDDDTDDTEGTITHTAMGADYDGVVATPISVTLEDDDESTIQTSTSALEIDEGQRSSYTVELGRLPTGNVTVNISVVGNPDIKLVDGTDLVDEIELTFTTGNWDDAQTVSVSAAEDVDTRADMGSLLHVATGADFTGTQTSVNVTVTENDFALITIEPTELTMVEGRSATYTIELGTQPTSNVTIRVNVADNRDVTASPAVLTFTPTDWSTARVVTVRAAADTDTINDEARLTHIAQGADYDGEMGDDVVVFILEDGTSVKDTSSFLRSSSCDNTLRLSWNSPTATGLEVINQYLIQWKSGDEEYNNTNLAIAAAGTTSYILNRLDNGVVYTLRMTAESATNEVLWSREIEASPSASPCVAEIEFGNILADSTPVIVKVADPEPGTKVNMRYRSLNPGVWSEVQSKILAEGEDSASFDIRGLRPVSQYEIQSWLGDRAAPAPEDAGTPEASAVQTVFTTGAAPAGATFSGGSRGGRILRIEPGIRSVTLSAGDQVLLSVEVWGRQDLLDNGLADKDPANGRPTFTWFSNAGGSFTEANIRSEWSNDVADDRTAYFTAPQQAGTILIDITLDGSSDCTAAREGETAADQEARCSARIEVTVRRESSATLPESTAPVNPPGIIPEVLSDSDGVAHAVFTPVEGGNFVGEGYSVSAGPGAVANAEFIGLSMTPIGDASNVGKTWHRYTLGGQIYAIGAVDAIGTTVSSYAFGVPAVVCVPMPNELRGSIADIVLTSTNVDGNSTVLSTRVKITPEGVQVCGNLSTVPANVAVGKVGSPPEIEDPDAATDGSGEPLPDTGGAQPMLPLLYLLAILGMVVSLAGTTYVWRVRQRS